MKDLFISRKFWAAFFLLAVTVVSAFLPSFNLDMDTAAGLAVLVTAYILGVAKDPGVNAGTWRGIISSRKFWAAAVGLIVLILDGFGIGLPLGFSTEQIVLIVATFGGYIAGVAVEEPPVLIVEETPGVSYEG